MNPLDLRGPDFLRFYAICFGVAIVMVLILRQMIRRSSMAAVNARTPLKPDALAYLAGGPQRAVQVALVSLMERGVVTVSNGGVLVLQDPATDAIDSPLERAVRNAARTKGTTFAWLRRYCREPLSDLEERLASNGFAVSAGLRQLALYLSLLIFGLVVSVGVAKVFIGLSRNRPVTFLVAELIVSLLIGLPIALRPLRRTPAGDEALRSIPADPTLQFGLPVAVALGGATALIGTEFAEHRQHLRERTQSTWGGDSAGSCGSSCGGGSCGGGGCGGGGCGGCSS